MMPLSVGADQPTTIARATPGNSKLDTTHVVPALAGLLGLAGYVYVLGGLALYIELFRTGFPQVRRSMSSRRGGICSSACRSW